MADTSGKTIEIPIRANFREGLECFRIFYFYTWMQEKVLQILHLEQLIQDI